MTDTPSPALGRLVASLGVVALLASVWCSFQALAVAFGLRARAAGGGEFFIALAGGAPALAVALASLGTCAMRSAWRSRLAIVGFLGAALFALVWIIGLLRGP